MKHFRIMAVFVTTAVLMLSFTTIAYAASDTSGETSEISTAFTPAGTGTVMDNATGENGKEFYTITTPDKKVFYLIIDRERQSDNVYFLNAVTEKDLLALAESSSDSGSGNKPDVTSEPKTDTGTDATSTPAASQHSNSAGTLVLVIAVVLIGGGAGYYFKIYRPKHKRAGMEEDDDYSPMDEKGSDSDLPPWDEDENDYAGDSEDETK